LFFEFHGTSGGVSEQVDIVKSIAGGHGAGEFHWADTPEDRSKLWQARHDAYYAALALRPGAKGWATDVCVPISRLAECIGETKHDLARSAIPSALVGHVGDGNFHLVFMIDPQRPEEIAEASRLNDRMVARALAMDGTSTGEHGVGYGKMGFMPAEHGEGLAVMAAIKKALDPQNILNPGKIMRI
jgi:D-lactate dehydrogenase (cytochrome)